MVDTPALPEGTVTVVFTDVEGSTALRSAVGDDRGHQVLAEHDDLVRKVLLEHGGTEVKALGDGFLLVFTSTRRAVEFAVALHAALDRARLGPADRPVRVRIGLHTGEVVARDGDLFGQAVHAAARIQSVSRGGQTLVSDVVKSLVGSLDGVAWEGVGEHELKGFDEPWALWSASGVADEADDGGAVPLVARGAEHARLLAALDDAARGKGAAVMIQGAAGVGKSRLAHEVADEAKQRGFRVLRSRCSERNVTTPFAPWVDLLRAGIEDTDAETLREALGEAGAEIARVLPELRSMFPGIPEPQRLPPDQERRFILESVAGFIARGSATRPLVLLIDDAHWADEGSIALLDETAPHVGDYPILFLATSRPPEQALASVVARAVKDRDLTLINLEPLDSVGVGELLRALTGQAPPGTVVEQMTARTGGNPFYVTELVQHLREEGIGFDDEGNWLPDSDLAGAGVPDSIRLVLRARLDRVSDEVRHVLAGAAIVGRSAELKVVGHVADAAPGELVDALDVAEKAGLVITEVDGAGRTVVTFVHDLIRDAVLADLTLVRTQQLHLKAGTAMRELYGLHPQTAAAIADHLVAAGALADEADTCEALLAAGQSAIDATAHADALRLFERARELARDSTLQRARALRGVGTALRSIEGWESSLPRFMEALDLFIELGDVDAVGTLASEIIIELGWAFKLQESFEVIERGMKALSDLGGTDGDAWLLHAAARAALLALLGAGAQALDALEEVVARVGEMDHPPPPTVTLAVFQTHIMLGNLPEVLAIFDQETDRLRDAGDNWTFCEFLGWAGFNLVAAGRVDDARAVAEEGWSLAERLGHLNAKVLIARARATLAVIDGDLNAAMAHAREDERICAEQGYPWIVQAWVFQAHHQLLRGNWEEADRLARKALTGDVFGAFGGTGVAIAALVRGIHGDEAGVVRLYREHLEPTLDSEINWVGRHAMLTLMTLALGLVDRVDILRALRPALWRVKEQSGSLLTWIIVPHALADAVAAAADGELDTALAALEEARAAIESGGLVPAYTELNSWEAWVRLRAGGDAVDEVPALLDRAEAAYREAGMDRHLELVDRLRARMEIAAG